MLGAIIGDVVGSVYEFNNVRTKDFEMFNQNSFLTDDSIMTLAVAEILQKKYVYDKDKIIDTLKKWGRTYKNRGYGNRFYNWLLSDDRNAYKSYGNGAAMRISPVGWYANSEEEVKDFARRITEVTHNHKEGLKGAEVTAMCVYYAKIGKSKEFIKEYVKQYYNIDFNYEDLRKHYQFNETCQESVPQAIYCFLISNSFEDCLRTTISIGGDCDTTAAISCAIAEAYYKNINSNLINLVFERLPKANNNCNPLETICSFGRFVNYKLTNCEEITDDTRFICIDEYDKKNDKKLTTIIHSNNNILLMRYLLFLVLDRYFKVESLEKVYHLYTFDIDSYVYNNFWEINDDKNIVPILFAFYNFDKLTPNYHTLVDYCRRIDSNLNKNNIDINIRVLKDYNRAKVHQKIIELENKNNTKTSI